MKWASETCAIRARVGTSSGSAYARSIESRARSSRRLASSAALPTRRGSDVDAALRQPRDGVDALAVHPALVDLEVQVRAGRLAAVAQQRDRLTGLHVLP